MNGQDAAGRTTGQGSTALSKPPRTRLVQHVRNGLLRGAAVFGPSGDAPLPDLGALRRVLLVYVNFRLGNTILATAGVSSLLRALPDAEVDFLGGPSARAVFKGYPLRRVLTMSRHIWWNPIEFLPLRKALRARSYDAAIHVSTATASIGAWGAWLSNAPVRIGCAHPNGRNLYFTSTVGAPSLAGHKVERLNQYVAALGAETIAPRRMIMLEEELAEARAFLSEESEDRRLNAALFLSGRARKGKAWDLSFFEELAEGLRAAGVRPIVVLGPEEQRRKRSIQRRLGEARYVERRSLRQVAAILQRCQVAVVPDSGPMHMAIAVGVPTVALFRNADAWKWGPQEGEGLVVQDPEGRDARQALASALQLLGATTALRNSTSRPDSP